MKNDRKKEKRNTKKSKGSEQIKLEETTKTSSLKPWYLRYVAVIFFVVTFIAYFNVIKGEFFFDDDTLILQNKYVHNLELKKIYTSNTTEGANLTDNFYRPHHQLVFSLLYNLFGKNPIPFHLFNILVHIMNGFLIYILLLRLQFKPIPSVVGTLFYLVHPIHTEAVSYISGIGDPLGFMFMLAALLAILKGISSPSPKHVINFTALGLFLYVNSLLCKESHVILASLLIVCLLYLYPPQTNPEQKIFTSYFYCRHFYGNLSFIKIYGFSIFWCYLLNQPEKPIYRELNTSTHNLYKYSFRVCQNDLMACGFA